MSKHIVQILETVDKLKAIGEEINEAHVSALFLCSLPSSYDTLITALEARSELELTPEFIRSKLMDEFNKRKENSSFSYENDSKAYKAQTKNQNYKFNKKFCTFCNMRNHFRSECYHLKNKNFNYVKHQAQNSDKNKQKSKQSQCFQATFKIPRSHPSTKVENLDLDPDDKNKEKSHHRSFLVSENPKENWIIDSGSSVHITNKIQNLSEIKDNNINNVIIANGKTLQSEASGNIHIISKTKNGNQPIVLRDVLYVPELETNLISVKKATEHGCEVLFKGNECQISHNGQLLMEGTINNNLYEAKVLSDETHTAHLVKQCMNKNCIELWHRRLGHKNYSQIKQLINENMAVGIKIDRCTHSDKCENCITSKLTDNPYPKSAQFRATKVLQLVHSDISGPFQTPTIGGKTYFITFVDDYSRFTIVYLLSNKSEAFSKLREYVAMTSNKFGRKPEMIRSDNGGEYVGKEIENYLREQGITHQLSVPYCSSQNGVAERKNRTLVEMTRCLLREALLPRKFWGEALNTATYLQNRLPTKSNKVTPYQLWTGRKPDLSHVKVFGCKAYYYIHNHKRSKLDDKAKAGIMLGYDNRSKGYRIYSNDGKVIICRTAKFVENTNAALDEELAELNLLEEKPVECQLEIGDEDPVSTGKTIQRNVTTDSSKDGNENQPRRSERANKGVPPDRLVYFANDEKLIEPKSWQEVQDMENQYEKEKWIKATEEEMQSLQENKTWKLVDPPSGEKVIGCRWTFKAKYDNSGHIEKFKARLVAKGYSQKYGCDYDETFAPVVTHTTIRSFLSMALHKNLKVNHIDVKTAFLHGELKESVYMRQPEGYEKKGEEEKVCKLEKAIYGLKQAARAWHLKIEESLIKLNFQQSTTDPCLYKQTKGQTTTYLIVYVDDILIAGNEENIKNV